MGAIEAVEAALEPLGGAVARDLPGPDGRVHVQVYLTERPDRARVTAQLAAAALATGLEAPEVSVEALPDRDWIAESQELLPPIRVGPFYVYGSHVEARPPPGSVPLRVEASLAFGTGRHESTRGCLLALADLANERRLDRALDMGCGSGILALAMAKLWGCPVTAVDNDPDAVRLAGDCAHDNNAADLVSVYCGDGYRSPAVAKAAPYDLIAANILAGPLCDMAPDLVRHLALGGVAILSGLLKEQEARVRACHAPLQPVRTITLGDWVTLMMERR